MGGQTATVLHRPGYRQPVCQSCGWLGHAVTVRTVEHIRMADRAAAAHRCGDYDPFRAINASTRRRLGLPEEVTS